MLPRQKSISGKKPRATRLYLESWAVLDFTETILQRMEEDEVTRTELARRLKTSKAWITKLLKGENVTLRTAARVAHALGFVVDVRLVEVGALPP